VENYWQEKMANVRLKSIYKSFDGLEVLHNLDFKIVDGEFVVLVGPSGCGKSTTLRLIAGLEEVTSGEIQINGRAVNDLEPRYRNIAMVFQNYALYPHKNVRENIVFGLQRAGASRELIAERLGKVSKTLGLEALLDRRPSQLSGGQRQRVAMGRAIVRDADVFLFDEPLSNLDAKLRYQMRSEIIRIHREYRTTSIYVTHDQTEAMTLGERVVVMRDGIIEQQGNPMEIYLKPANIFVATFIGSPSMNILDARLFPGRVEVGEQRLPLKRKVDQGHILIPEQGRDIKFGIRPDFFLDARFSKSRVDLARIENVRIDMVESLGFDREFSIHAGGQAMKADLRTMAGEGETIDLCVDMDMTHFFDPDTGRNLFV
jgi:multiple sugar transport system ATP-binding protein